MMSSFSHWMTVRPGIAAFSTGTRSTSGSRVITKPPTWMDRCRGTPSSSFATDSVRSTRPSVGDRPASWSTSGVTWKPCDDATRDSRST
ncbi:hypothetical protein COEX109129_42525 [Corallococcus exiguus]